MDSIVSLRMDASAGSSNVSSTANTPKKYLAFVQEKEGCVSMTQVPTEPMTAKEYKTKLKAQQTEVKELKVSLKKAAAAEIAEHGAKSKRFKRSDWADASQMTVMLPGKGKKQVDVMLTDSWLDLKKHICDEFCVAEDEYDLVYVSTPSDTYLVRGKPMQNVVGKLNIWDGSLVLKRKRSAPTAPSSSSSS